MFGIAPSSEFVVIGLFATGLFAAVAVETVWRHLPSLLQHLRETEASRSRRSDRQP